MCKLSIAKTVEAARVGIMIRALGLGLVPRARARARKPLSARIFESARAQAKERWDEIADGRLGGERRRTVCSFFDLFFG